jgi:hypothetical protein
LGELSGARRGRGLLRRSSDMISIIVRTLTPVLALIAATAVDAAALKPNRVDVEYMPPKSSDHDELYKLVQERRLLEKIRDLLAPLRLPRRLLLKTQGCDGEVNAWYFNSAITVCYEFLDWVWQSVPEHNSPAVVAPIDALIGPIVQIIIHEAGHAAFDLLRVPIFGREEDAADQFSAYVILQAGKEEARRLIAGAAYQYKSGVQSESQTIATKRFADEHGTMAQRFFNILCLAYGADAELFKDIVANGYLPKGRAEGCSDEYGQVAYAFKTLIGPNIDRKLSAKLNKSWLPPIDTRPPRRPPGSDVKTPP